MNRVGAWGCAIVFGTLCVLPRSPALTLSLSRLVCLPPCTVEARIRLEPHPANAMVRIAMDGPISRYSEIALAANSPPWVTVEYRNLPAGSYDIVADLVRHDGSAWIAGQDHARLTVVDSSVH